jgi:N-acylneuraminate cytidylyltransferase
MALASDDALLARTQDLPQSFFDAGKFYLATAQVWRERETMMAKPFVPYLLPDWASVDIDEPADWAVAEALHEAFVLRAP